MPSPPEMQPRSVERLVRGIATSDGAGVRLTRVLTQDLQRRLDPFLLLDSFRTDDPEDYLSGFPDHPHRGFETVTYMIAGRMRHRDSAGNEGLLGPGSAQWMSAGSGIVHSEMPEQEAGRMEGFQLWVNLPARSKMSAPGYRDIPAAAIPEFAPDSGVRVRVIAGASHGIAGAVERPDTEPLLLDLQLAAGSRFEQPLPAAHNAFVYVYRGSVDVAGTTVPERHMGILANDGGAAVVTAPASDARVLLVAGRPLGEPIVQQGPFVMNTSVEIRQAIRDFQSGALQAGAVRKL
ncbi:MAG: pirin family protein [Gammaproteobacteria bacterium]|nr:MAG: pirin family protein [Gammaproteobacteria bacterium]